MSPRMLLDTGVLVHIVRESAFWERLGPLLGVRLSEALVSRITHGELLSLASRRQWGAIRMAVWEEVFGKMTVLEITDEVAEQYAAIQSFLHARPKGSQANRGENDCWIAACCIATGATLVTMDQDFNPLHPAMLSRILVRQNSDRSLSLIDGPTR